MGRQFNFRASPESVSVLVGILNTPCIAPTMRLVPAAMCAVQQYWGGTARRYSEYWCGTASIGAVQRVLVRYSEYWCGTAVLVRYSEAVQRGGTASTGAVQRGGTASTGAVQRGVVFAVQH